MPQPTVIHSTFVIERQYSLLPAGVFAAFSDPATKRRWFVEGGGNSVAHYEMEFRPGGKERARFSHGGAVAGIPFTNDATYLDIVPDRRIVLASTMTMGENCISASLVTFEFLPVEAGTELIFTHQGAFFEGADGPAIREAGWGKLLERLGEELNARRA